LGLGVGLGAGLGTGLGAGPGPGPGRGPELGFELKARHLLLEIALLLLEARHRRLPRERVGVGVGSWSPALAARQPAMRCTTSGGAASGGAMRGERRRRGEWRRVAAR